MPDDDEERPAPPPFALGRSETTTSATTVGIANFARRAPSATSADGAGGGTNHGARGSAAAPALAAKSRGGGGAEAAVGRLQRRPIINLLDESLDAVLDDDDDDEYDEDGIEIPPPPPPKLPTLKESMARRVVLLQSWRPRNTTFAFAKGSSSRAANEDDNSSIRIVTLAKSGTETTAETNIMNDDNNDDNNKKKRQRGIGIGIAALLLTVIVALGLGLGLRGVRDDNSEKNSSSSNEAFANDIADTEENGTVDQEGVNEPSSSSSSSTPPPPATTTTTYDVIIIGAGWAGIRALETLLSRNITNVLLIESTSVIGGRCRSYNADGSVNDPDIIVDDDDDDSTTTAAATYNVGADWLYADTDMSNVLLDGGYLDGNDNTYPATTDTAIPNGLLTGQYYYRQTATRGSSSSSTVVDDDDDDDDDDTTDDAGIITTTFITAKAMSEQSTSNLMNDIWGNFHTTRTNELNDMFGMSYDDAIDYYIDNNLWLYDYTVNTDDIIAATAAAATTAGMAMDFLNFMKSSSEIENSGDSSKLDITDINYLPPGYTSDSYYMGGVGFGNLVAQYAQKYISYIMLNSRVITIDSSEESSSSTPDVTVVSYVTDTNDDDGINSGSSTTTTTVQAKTVLVTVSLGVLKSDRIQFIPPLPENKRTIINAMGYGTLNKCILSWKSNDAIVWPIDESWFMLLTESNNNNNDDEEEEEESAAVQRGQRWTTFFNPTLLTGQPTLVAYVGGDDAIATESQTRNDILEDVMTNLRSMFPDITNPDNVIVTRWGSEEDFYGAYAYPIAGRVMAEDAAILAEPIGRLYFAGEATSATRWGTTMGAWNTGEEQAYAITARLLGW